MLPESFATVVFSKGEQLVDGLTGPEHSIGFEELHDASKTGVGFSSRNSITSDEYGSVQAQREIHGAYRKQFPWVHLTAQ
jgi:hypothetical protein